MPLPAHLRRLPRDDASRLYAIVTRLWRTGRHDTMSIAEKLGVKEAKVYAIVNRYVGSAEAKTCRARRPAPNKPLPKLSA